MRILVTNDDGIHAAGIAALAKELTEIGEVMVAAPDTEKSATSQAITVHQPIRVDRYCGAQPLQGWRIGGTPTDCVKIAVEALMEEPPDIVVSGINHGPNLGTDVLYSGTVSAAIEGALHGIPAIAVSLDAWQEEYDFTVAAQYARKVVERVSREPIPAHTLLNINVPNLAAQEIKGIAVTRLGVRQYENVFEQRQDPRGRHYYWMGGKVAHTENAPDSDIVAVQQGYVSITPIQLDLTDESLRQQLQTWSW